MTDREMLLLAYGAVRAMAHKMTELKDLSECMNEHLFPSEPEEPEADITMTKIK